MLSKCANPECSEQFKYLHQGKLFQLTPTPEVQAVEEGCCRALYERFWLCDRCSKLMTLVWGGTKAKLIPLPPKVVLLESANPSQERRKAPGKKRIARIKV